MLEVVLAVGAVVGTGLFVYLSAKKKPQACSKCAKPMTLLSESEEDRFLTIEQQAEENLGIIDHHVWICEKCEEVRIVEETRKSGHDRCPKCNRATLTVKNTVLKQPTKEAQGTERIEQDCDSCGYTKNVECQIATIGTIVFGGEGGMQSWQCPTCSTFNYIGAIHCGNCRSNDDHRFDSSDF